jgi:AraC-like DNA-binding protein
MAVSDRIEFRRDPAGAWEMARGAPAPPLAGLVGSYVGFCERAREPLLRRETPSENVTLIVNFGVPLEIGAVGGGRERFAGSFLARISAVPAVTAFTGCSEGVQIDLSPLGAHMLLDLPMDELPEPVVGLAEVLGREGEVLADRLASMGGWEARFDHLDGLFLRRFAAARAPQASVEWAWRTLLASGGAAPVGALSARLGCSPRHLIAGFRRQIGVGPKQAASIIRFGRAARRLRAPGATSLARLALECGYHDQSHMTREFRRFAGTTPAAFATARHPGYLGVDETKVNSVQDGGIASA